MMSFSETDLRSDQLSNSDMAGDNRDFIQDNPNVIETYGLDLKVASKLYMVYQSGKLAPTDLDKRAIDALRGFPVEGALNVLTQLLQSDLKYVSNKSAFLCGIMKTYRLRTKRLKNAGLGSFVNMALASAPSKGPDEDKIRAILERTGYTLDVTTGQRKYGGPPPNWNGPPPGPGCEVFCGRIPKDVFEDELVLLFEKSGVIWDLRLMVDPIARTNRSFAFVTFCSQEEARQAAIDLNHYEIKPGKYLQVNISEPNKRLFVGNIPKSKDKKEVIEEFKHLTAGLKDAIVCTSPSDKFKNRGFCFLDYESHHAAFLAKLRLGQVKVWGYDVLVDWADPQEEPDSETMAKVKVLYVRNLSQECSEENLKEAFEAYGTINRVRKLRDYAFIYFKEKEHAITAMNDLNGKDVGGSCIEVCLAKPLSDYKKRIELIKLREHRKLQIMQIRAGSLSQQHSSPGPMPLGGLMPLGGPMQRGSSSMIQPIGHGDYAWAWNSGSQVMEWGYQGMTAAATTVFSNHNYEGLNGHFIMATPTTTSPPMALNAPSEFYQVNGNWMGQEQEESGNLYQNNWAIEPLVQEPQEITYDLNGHSYSMTEVPQWYQDSYRT